MKSSFWFLCRRSTAPWMTIVYAAVLVAVTVTRETWMYSSLTAVNWVSGGLLLALPIVAGAAAYDGWRFHRGDWRESLLPTMRASRSLGVLASLHTVAILIVWLILCAIAIGITVSNGAVPQVSLAMLAQPALLCIFVAFAGVTAGALVPRVWIAPVAAVGFFALSVTAENYGPYQRFVTALGFTAWSPYTQLDLNLLWLKCLALVLLVAACFVAWRSLSSSRSIQKGARTASVTLAAAAMLVVAVAGSNQSPGSNGIDQRPWQGTLACSGETIAFCTNEPSSLAEPFIKEVESAFASLGQYGIVPPAKYVDDRTLRTGEASAGAWSIDPAFLVSGKPAPDVTASTVSRPAACPEYYADVLSSEGERLLGASSLVFDFVYIVEQSINTGENPAITWSDWHPELSWVTMLEGVGQMYAALSVCDPSALPVTPA